MDEAPDLAEYSRFAEELADAAAAVALGWIGEAADKNAGGAFDPVTEADRGAERAMRAMIAARYPDHGISGEEYGDVAGSGPWRWSLDPIDGTRAFICGLPSWTVLIALLHDNAPVLGVIDAPALGERFVGTGGEGWLTAGGVRQRLGVSCCRTLAAARLSTTDPHLFGAEGETEAEAFHRVRHAVRLTRYGLDGYAYGRLAAGTIDLVIESGLKPHDYNALGPVVRAAGGAFGNWEGGEDLSRGRVVAAASQELFDAAVRRLAGP